MSLRTRPAGIVAGIALSIVMIVCSSGCSDQPETIPDGHPPTLDAGTDSTTTEIDGGTDAPMNLDVCEQQSPPPQGGYTLTSISWKCGQAADPGNLDDWSIQGPVWAQTAAVVEPFGAMCGVTIPNYADVPMDYTALTIRRSSPTGPFRFYFGATTSGAGTDFVCWDRSWIGQGS